MSSVLNTGNWYEPLTPVMAGILLLLSILIEAPLIVACLTGEKGEWREIKVFLVVIGANVVSFLVGYLLSQLWRI